MKRALYSAVGHAAYRSGLARHFLRHQGAICAFHRVHDERAASPITVSRAEFSSYLRFFADHFEVIRLGEMLDRLRQGRSLDGTMVITFDDGYLDNAEWAAPELSRFGLTGCFFVTTGFVGSDTVPRWDRGWGVKSEWMTWDHIRALHQAGHEIGDHTVSHPDLGSIDPEQARVELTESRRALEEAVGAPIRFFAYPFGGPHQLSERNRQLVRDLGFDCCLSAHGGIVCPGDDPFRLQRLPITVWHRDPYQFGVEMLRFAAERRNARSQTVAESVRLLTGITSG